jgi:sec-independent protein translocase protein TatC
MAKRNPERRMSLGGHLRELRNRLYWSALFIALGSVGGWFFFEPVFALLQEPFKNLAAHEEINATINFGSVSAPFDLRMQVSIFLGLIIASPFWLFNFWAYISPALNIRTKRIAVVFAATATPLFLAGCYIAWTLIPTFVKSLLSFTPEGSAAMINANDYILFALRILIVFGFALVLPAVLLLLNYLGVLSSATILKGWRLAVLIAAVIAALATPVSDPMSMLLLALPLIALYFVAAFIAKLFDRRKRKLQTEPNDVT